MREREREIDGVEGERRKWNKKMYKTTMSHGGCIVFGFLCWIMIFGKLTKGNANKCI